MNFVLIFQEEKINVNIDIDILTGNYSAFYYVRWECNPREKKKN